MKNKIALILRLVASIILLQTLFFKFTGAPESKFIFGTLGIEPWGRWLSGVAELFASILLLIPATQVLGALVAIGVMMGAILSHVFVLGIVVQNDGGLLFALACIVLISSSLVLLLRQDQVRSWISWGRSILKSSSQ
jgi:putative oxidoreductase